MQLVGYIDGVEVRFDFYPPNQFKAEIPKNKSGTYVLELHSIDDAGNMSNYTNMLIAIDFQSLKVNMLPMNYNNKTIAENNCAVEITSSLNLKEIKSLFTVKELCVQFSYKELIR